MPRRREGATTIDNLSFKSRLVAIARCARHKKYNPKDSSSASEAQSHGTAREEDDAFSIQVTNENGEGSTEITFGTGSITGWSKSKSKRICFKWLQVQKNLKLKFWMTMAKAKIHDLSSDIGPPSGDFYEDKFCIADSLCSKARSKFQEIGCVGHAFREVRFIGSVEQSANSSEWQLEEITSAVFSSGIALLLHSL